MGLLKRDKAPDELPELALESPAKSKPFVHPEISSVSSSGPVSTETKERVGEREVNVSSIPDIPKESSLKETVLESQMKTEEKVKEGKVKEDKVEDKIETNLASSEKLNLEKIKSELANQDSGENFETPKFFDKILNDINDGIQDLGKMEDWYKNKFSSQDIVSNMKGYWEGNKADIIIQSFGAEYKKKIMENIKNLQALEEEWRVVYFQLIKKEEEMKKVEQDLKSTLSEFVSLCKDRKNGDENEKNETEKIEEKKQ